MPFKSKSQQRWMYATNSKMAKRWAKHTSDIKDLPDKKESICQDMEEGADPEGFEVQDFSRKSPSMVDVFKADRGDSEDAS